MEMLLARAAVSAACCCLVLQAKGAAAQLPPEIRVDRYLLYAEKQSGKRDFFPAKQAMHRIPALRAQHVLELSEAFFFQYPQVSEGAGRHDGAIESVTRYLTLAGREGAHYREALQLLNSAETVKAAAVEATRRRAEEAIAGMEFGTVQGGSFQMGSKSREASRDERPVTRVVISRAFELEKYEVTSEQWEAVMGTNPSWD